MEENKGPELKPSTRIDVVGEGARLARAFASEVRRIKPPTAYEPSYEHDEVHPIGEKSEFKDGYYNWTYDSWQDDEGIHRTTIERLTDEFAPVALVESEELRIVLLPKSKQPANGIDDDIDSLLFRGGEVVGKPLIVYEDTFANTIEYNNARAIKAAEGMLEKLRSIK